MELALFIFRLRVLLCRLVKHQTKSSWLGNCQQSPLFCCIALFYHCPKVGPMDLECHMCLPKGQVHTFSHTILTTKLIEPFKHPFYIFCLTFLRNRFIVQITSSLQLAVALNDEDENDNNICQILSYFLATKIDLKNIYIFYRIALKKGYRGNSVKKISLMFMCFTHELYEKKYVKFPCSRIVYWGQIRQSSLTLFICFSILKRWINTVMGAENKTCVAQRSSHSSPY